MRYLWQAAWALVIEWAAPKVAALNWSKLKAKALAAFKKLRTRNTGGQ